MFKMKSPKSIQELYEEVKDFDMVITNDAPLATALNKRIKKAQIGKLAYTPQELAAKFAPRLFLDKINSKTETILKLSQKLKKNIKSIHNTIEKIQDIEKYTDDIQNYLTKEEKEIYYQYKELPTVQKALREFSKEYLPKNIAIIEPDLFNNLDKKAIPDKYVRISILTKYTSSDLNVHTYSDQDQLIEEAINLITKDNQDDFAIILNTQDPVLNVIKSKLYKNQIDINIKEFLDENLNVRVFLDLLNTALHLEAAIVKEIKPFLESFNIDIDYKYNNYLLERYIANTNKDKKLTHLYQKLIQIRNMSYKEYMSLFTRTDFPPELKETLFKTGLYEEKINEDNFSDLIYFINNFDIKISSCKKGVLLADCKSSVVVDKPICLYINPDSEWTKKVPVLPYIDKELEENNNLNKFQIFIKQGQVQVYFATLIKGNQKTIPCFYFNKIFGKEIKGFSDEVFHKIGHNINKNLQIEEKKIISDDIYKFGMFSQSSLNTFFECPKKFEFSRVVPSEEKNYFMKGTLLHAFAEFYVSHKDFCNAKGDDFFVNILLDEYMNMVESTSSNIEKTMFLIGIKNIKSYIDSLDIDVNHNIKSSSNFQKHDENLLSIKLNKPITGNNTEVSFSDVNSKLKGFIDLVINDTMIVDYKSSKSKKTVGKIISKSNLKLIKDEADFQPLVYLMQLRSCNPDKELSFYYYFFIQNYKKVIGRTDDQEDNIVRIKYYPVTFDEFIRSDEGLGIITSRGKRADIIKLIGEKDIKSVLRNNPVKNPFVFDKNIPAYRKLEKKATNIKDTTKNKGIVEDFFKEIYRLRTGGSNHPIALFFKEDLDKFQDFVNREFELVKLYSKIGFPKTPKSKKVCDNCDYKDVCLGA